MRELFNRPAEWHSNEVWPSTALQCILQSNASRGKLKEKFRKEQFQIKPHMLQKLQIHLHTLLSLIQQLSY